MKTIKIILLILVFILIVCLTFNTSAVLDITAQQLVTSTMLKVLPTPYNTVVQAAIDPKGVLEQGVLGVLPGPVQQLYGQYKQTAGAVQDPEAFIKAVDEHFPQFEYKIMNFIIF